MELGYIDGHEATYLKHKSNQEIMAESTTVMKTCTVTVSIVPIGAHARNLIRLFHDLYFSLEMFFLLLELGFE